LYGNGEIDMTTTTIKDISFHVETNVMSDNTL
jgi:hypothetical protein